MRSFSLRQLFFDHVGQTSDSPVSLEIERAEGIYLFDSSGKRYVDMVSGVSVSNVGHSNPKVIQAIKEQADKYMHLMVYGEYIQSPQVLYAKKITDQLPDSLSNVYFVNSGSEANEGALKLAKRYTGRTEIISFKNAYHGSTQGALSIMGGEEWKNAFRPLLPDTRQINFNNFNDTEQITAKTACVIVEPIQGEGGIIPPAPGFLQQLRKRCSETNTLLIFDEIQTGLGRTGSLYAFQKYDVIPDIVTTAKAFGGGMPLGAFISSSEIMSCLKSNPSLGHITTFGGHPVSCAAGLAALEVLLEEKLMDEVASKSDLFKKLLQHPKIKEIRGEGLMLAVELSSAKETVGMFHKLLDKGLITDFFLFHNTAFRIAPPLTITHAQIVEICQIILECLNDL